MNIHEAVLDWNSTLHFKDTVSFINNILQNEFFAQSAKIRLSITIKELYIYIISAFTQELLFIDIKIIYCNKKF